MKVMQAISAGLVGAILMLGAMLYAQSPNISKHRHPNLAAAQRLCDEAIERITNAQRANEFDLGGHAAKAKDLLQQASGELKEAAEEANERK